MANNVNNFKLREEQGLGNSLANYTQHKSGLSLQRFLQTGSRRMQSSESSAESEQVKEIKKSQAKW